MNLAAEFDWSQQLEKTVVSSLVTSFGLDFLLFKDKIGGDVNTIHNVRQGVHATEAERQQYDQRGSYTKEISDAYHKHSNYIAHGVSDKQQHQAGTLKDAYRQQPMAANEIKKRDLDHTISSKNIHDDQGRVLAGLDGVELANQDSNLASTHHSINRSKNSDSINVFLARLETTIPQFEADVKKKQQRLSQMPRDTPEQQQNFREWEDNIRKEQEKIEVLKSTDSEGMREQDRKARAAYEGTISQTYYTSSKFLKTSAVSSATSGLLMGTRQMLGLVMAEIWFELREQLSVIFQKIKTDFEFKAFIDSIALALKNIWNRICIRFNDFLITFKDGMFAGILSSLTTTLWNIFATSQKMAVKLIREMWSSLVEVIKIISFNPDNLSTVEMMKAVSSILAIGVSTVLGTMIYSALLPVLNFPFGAELAAFIGALSTGIITLGLQYFISHSTVMKKVWDFIDSLGHSRTLEQFRAINAKLDFYLQELAQVEFNLDPWELQAFASNLLRQNSELGKSIFLRKEVERRNIELPFEMGNHASTRKWLSGLANK